MIGTIERFLWDGSAWGGSLPELMPVGEMVALLTEKPEDPPPAIAQRLSEHWGATSLHGMVFRRPKGFIWWHCEKCQLRVTPSGRRIVLYGALHNDVSGPVSQSRMTTACVQMAMWRNAEERA